MPHRSVASRLHKGATAVLRRGGNYVTFRLYDRTSPQNIDLPRGEATASPPYLFTDVAVLCGRSEVTPMKASAVVEVNPQPESIPVYRYFTEGDVAAVTGDIIFDPEGASFSSTTDPAAAGWGIYKILHVYPHKANSSNIYKEFIVQREDRLYV